MFIFCKDQNQDTSFVLQVIGFYQDSGVELRISASHPQRCWNKINRLDSSEQCYRNFGIDLKLALIYLDPGAFNNLHINGCYLGTTDKYIFTYA